jgi:hypothetical protein
MAWTVTDGGTFIQLEGAVWSMLIVEGNQGAQAMNIYDPTVSTVWYRMRQLGRMQVGGANYQMSRDPGAIVNLISNTGDEVVIDYIGIPNDGGVTPLANVTSMTQRMTFTESANTIRTTTTFICTDSIAITSDLAGNNWFGFRPEGAASITNGFGEGGSETTGNTTTVTRNDYYFQTSSLGNLVLIPISISDETGDLYGYTNEGCFWGYNNVTLPAGTYTSENVLVLDIAKAFDSEAGRESLLALYTNVLDGRNYADLLFRDREIVYNLLGDAGFTGDYEDRLMQWGAALGLTSSSIPDLLFEAYIAGHLTDGT